MSLYQKIKSAITVRQVGEMYGMEPDRHGMVCCPFHSDNHPSMMLNESYYYCFACGANGDAIDLTAKLFDLNPRQAAEKLIHDFGLDPDKPPANAIALPPPKRGLTDEQWADIAYCLRVLTDYLDLLHDWQERYKPASPEEPLDERFVEALQMQRSPSGARWSRSCGGLPRTARPAVLPGWRVCSAPASRATGRDNRSAPADSRRCLPTSRPPMPSLCRRPSVA